VVPDPDGARDRGPSALHGPVRLGTLTVMRDVFTQTMTFRSDQPQRLIALAREWDALQVAQDVTGFMESRILADRDDPGRYVMIVDFGVVDPDVSAAQEAFLNNDRPETRESADRFRAVVENEPEWHHYDEIYRTSFAAEAPPR
jgi:hypothetical protein